MAPVPVLSAAQSPGAVRRAARAGLGLLFDSLQPPERVHSLVETYRVWRKMMPPETRSHNSIFR